MKTGLDVVKAAMLCRTFGFGTGPMIAMDANT
ncbi:MAG: hypothetical protein CM15mP76_12620 [Prochlorococcus sp.]|nr:MAG: hypothetical protein CM15mP76_12620 [Prochlorococcus sp.]